jgi:cyclopropane-fatty-acyl-phospholipid synthase
VATQKEIESTYDYMDDFFRLSFGNNADVSCGYYKGDFSLSLEEAQRRKHDFILRSIKFRKGDRVLDVGCGWGPVLKAVATHGGKGVGLTLSPAQAAACRAGGYEAYVKDWKEVDPKKIGKFDGITVVEPFEHFCSIEEFKAGKQDKIYNDFFKLCHDLLPKGARLYLQTMTFGKRVPKPEEFDVNAPYMSDNWVWGHLSKFYPGSWAANGARHIEKCAKPYFRLILEDDGRIDYIHTMKEFGKKNSEFSIKKLFYAMKLMPRYLTDKNFRYQIKSLRNSCNRLCFERDMLRLPRLVFERL